MNYFAHESCCIGSGAQIGSGTKIWQFCTVLDGAEVGTGCLIGSNVFIENKVRLGDRVKVKNQVSLYNGVECGDDVFLGPACVFTNVVNPRSFIQRKHEFKKTIVKKGATIGANATILCGVTVGRYAFVGAGSVVLKDVPDYGIVVGNPARIIGYICECGVSLGQGERIFSCPQCGKQFALDNGILKEIEP